MSEYIPDYIKSNFEGCSPSNSLCSYEDFKNMLIRFGLGSRDFEVIANQDRSMNHVIICIRKYDYSVSIKKELCEFIKKHKAVIIYKCTLVYVEEFIEL